MSETKKTRRDQMVERVTQKFKKLSIKDPIAVVFLLLFIAAAYFYLFPSKKRAEADPYQNFYNKVENTREMEGGKAAQERQRIQEKFDRDSKAFNTEKAVQEERKQRLFAENKAKALEEKLLTQQEGFPKRKLREELIARCYYAPIQKGLETPTTYSDGPPKRAGEGLDSQGLTTPNTTNWVKNIKQLELRAGSWIPAILNGDMHNQVGGSQRATVREDVFDSKGQYVLIPKGSTAIVQFAQSQAGDAYHLSALAVKEIILPNGDVKEMPIPVHDSLGKAGLDPKKDGKFKRHYLEKIGMTVMIAGVSSFPALMVSEKNTNDLAEYQFMQATSQGIQSLLRESLNIPNEKIFQAGAHLNFFMLDSILMEPYEEAHFAVDTDQNRLRGELEELKTRMFQAQKLNREAEETLGKLTPESIRQKLKEISQLEEEINAHTHYTQRPSKR